MRRTAARRCFWWAFALGVEADSYDFLFFFAASADRSAFAGSRPPPSTRRPIRRSLQPALSADCAVSSFLLVLHAVDAFDTFPVIDAATAGGPSATATLIKIDREGLRHWMTSFRRAVGGADVPRSS